MCTSAEDRLAGLMSALLSRFDGDGKENKAGRRNRLVHEQNSASKIARAPHKNVTRNTSKLQQQAVSRKATAKAIFYTTTITPVALCPQQMATIRLDSRALLAAPSSLRVGFVAYRICRPFKPIAPLSYVYIKKKKKSHPLAAHAPSNRCGDSGSGTGQ